MEEIILKNGLINYRGQVYNYTDLTIVDTAVNIALLYDGSLFEVTVVANETTINGVLQTSAQMIIDTLSNGQS